VLPAAIDKQHYTLVPATTDVLSILMPTFRCNYGTTAHKDQEALPNAGGVGSRREPASNPTLGNYSAFAGVSGLRRLEMLLKPVSRERSDSIPER